MSLRKTTQNFGVDSMRQVAPKLQLPPVISLKQMLLRGAYSMPDLIRAKWAELGWENSTIGYAAGDVIVHKFPPNDNALSVSVVNFLKGYISLNTKQDGNHVYVTPQPYPDLSTYEVTVQTGNEDNAGTDAKVFIQMWGTPGYTDQPANQEHILDNSADNFERGKKDVFTISAPSFYFLHGIIVRHNNDGVKPGWLLDNISIRHTSSNQVWNFPCQRWFSSNPKEGALKYTFNPPNAPIPDLSYKPMGGGQEYIQTTGESGPTPIPQQGFSSIDLYNCSVYKHDLHIWVQDVTAGSPWKLVETLKSQYDNYGTCPAPGVDPVNIKFEEGHVHVIVAVDPLGELCGQNDPIILGCQNWTGAFLGDKEGISVRVVVS